MAALPRSLLLMTAHLSRPALAVQACRWAKAATQGIVAALRAHPGERPPLWWLEARSGRPLWSGLPADLGHPTQAWVPVKEASGPGALRPLWDLAQWTPNRFNALLGGPTPLAALLAGGLLGGGAGYAGGRLAEHVLGEDVVEPGKLSRLGLLLGGTAGMAPGAYVGSVAHREKTEKGQSGWPAWVEPNPLLGEEEKQSSSRFLKAAWDDLREELGPAPSGWFCKEGELSDGAGLFTNSIPTDPFGRVILEDPRTPWGIRQTAVGLLDAAENATGRGLVSPYDVGTIAAGMGSGMLSGMFVGKVLGALAGLTPQVQHTLQQTGMWAGALQGVVPLIFGRQG